MKKSIKPILAISLSVILLLSTAAASFATDDYEPLGACVRPAYESVQAE